MVSTSDEWKAMSVEEKCEGLADTDEALAKRIAELESTIDRLNHGLADALRKLGERIAALEAGPTS